MYNLYKHLCMYTVQLFLYTTKGKQPFLIETLSLTSSFVLVLNSILLGLLAFSYCLPVIQKYTFETFFIDLLHSIINAHTVGTNTKSTLYT